LSTLLWPSARWARFQASQRPLRRKIFPATPKFLHQELVIKAKPQACLRNFHHHRAVEKAPPTPLPISVGREALAASPSFACMSWVILSIVRFDFTEHGAEHGLETKLLFAHTGFPLGYLENLLHGWKLHYWEHLENFLAS